MAQKSELSFTGIVVIGFIVAILCAIILYGSTLIVKRFSPSLANAEYCLKKGKLGEAAAIADKIHDDKTRELLRGKIFFAASLQQQRDVRWKNYGIDSADWFNNPNVDSAVSCFQSVLALDSASVKAHYYLGILYKEKGWFHEAEEVLEAAMMIDSSDNDIRLALGALYSAMQRYNQAEYQFKQIIHSDAEQVQAAKNLAFLYRFHLEQPESAIVWLHHYIKLAQPGDLDLNQATIEFEDLQKRYPEFVPPEMKDDPRKTRVFIPHSRKSTR